MNRFRISTPEGTRDLLFTSCRALRQTEHAVRADLLELRADLPLNVAAENDLGGGVDGEIQHGGVLPFLLEIFDSIIPAPLSKVKIFDKIVEQTPDAAY